ncbi:MAG: four-carbon acid sugar kinase family protein [Mucilaginibacter sp.]|uniref:four-carbon acid sugar kinase family protein n=1 Tax=Mucilaginibacter sp. TaxID=1882438 RepID=UPI0032678375
MANKHNLLLAYYGDDFTGSTDAMEFLTRAGIKTVLFIEAPTPDQLSRYEGLQAIGIAGLTRSMTPDEMEKELLPAFSALKDLRVPHVHYKVCSTFDSSPHIGSIGKAADMGAKIFNAPFIPVLVAAPALGRYCAFGNLYARMGIGSNGDIFRLDRHPSMSKHPTTPADESDLRLHLAKQTSQPIGLVDILTVALPEDEAREKLNQEVEAGKKIVFFDAMYDSHLLPIAKLISKYATKPKPLFSIGSSGIEMALGKYWKTHGMVQSKVKWAPVGKAETMLVVSGSCSPVTASQIEYAVKQGFAPISIDTAAIAATSGIYKTIHGYIDLAVAYINMGLHVIMHTSVGIDDPRIPETHKAFKKRGIKEKDIAIKTAQLYGATLGYIAIGVAEALHLQRLVIAGGDTSSYVARTMGIEAVEMIAPVTPGAPLCRAYAPDSAAHNIEVNFKGGQVGPENYFELVLNGESTI